MTKLQKIVSEYRAHQDMSLRAFADALSENGVQISRQSIWNWENGQYQPDSDFLLRMLRFEDWRRDFGFDCMAAMHPDVFAPSGEIGKRLLNADGRKPIEA